MPRRINHLLQKTDWLGIRLKASFDLVGECLQWRLFGQYLRSDEIMLACCLGKVVCVGGKGDVCASAHPRVCARA